MHLHASAAGFYGRIRSPEPARRRSAHADYDTSMLSVRRPALALTTVPQAYWMMATVSDSAPARRAVACLMRNALKAALRGGEPHGLGGRVAVGPTREAMAHVPPEKSPAYHLKKSAK